MKKIYKIILTFFLLFIILVSHVSAVQAQTLEEQREEVIQLFMGGITRNFSYEEAEAYVAQEEDRVLETGTFRKYSSYGIDGNHSTSHGLSLVDYLQNYFKAHTNQSDLDNLYPYQVKFEELPRELVFYKVGGDGAPEFYVEYDNRRLNINSTKAYFDDYNKEYKNYFSEPIENSAAVDIEVTDANGNQRTVKVNTQIHVWVTPHRREFIFSFFHNRNGGISLAMYGQNSESSVMQEYATLESISDAASQSNSTVPTRWTLPYDWRMLSERRKDVPPVAWVLMSAGDNETIAIEPLIHTEHIISGFMNPNYTIQVSTENVYSGTVSPVMMGRPDSTGYFSINNADLDIIMGNKVTVDIFNENSESVYNDILEIYEYRPTALAHDSGYLTLERYFVNQDYMEGYTYPYATVTVLNLFGFGGGYWRSVESDANGYFYIEMPEHHDNFSTNVVSVDHPETGEEISVYPFPWTQWEFENVEW